MTLQTIKLKFKENKYFFLGFLVLLAVILANIFPEGFVISSTDTSQPINVRENFQRFFLDTPSSLFFLAFFYFFDIFNISPTDQLSLLLGLFVFGSYISFYIFSQIAFRKCSFLAKTLISLIYSLNFFTLYIFSTHALGYSYFFSLYVFLPLLYGFFIKFMKERRFVFSALFGIVLFLASPGFGNPAFALSFFISLLIIFFCLIILKTVSLNKNTLWSILIISIISIFVSFFWIIPLTPSVRSGVESLNTTNQTNLGWALRTMGNPLSYAFGLNHFSKDYFPFNFPYSDSSFFKNLFILLSFIPIVFSVFYFRKIKTFKNKKLFLLSLLVFLVLVSLNAKINVPFEKINYFFYNIWGMNTLRAYDKIAILIPFFLSLLVLISIGHLEKTGHKKKAIIILTIILLTPLPFYAGKLQQTMSMRYANLSAKNKNYQKSKLTFLVKIPSEYYQIQNKLKTDSEKSFIATLPNNLGDTGTGSSSYPKWKLNGVDPTQFLYGKPFIEANFQYIPDWYFSKTFNEVSVNPTWLPKLLGMMDAKYILYHLDAPEESVTRSLPKMRTLEKEGLIRNLEENDYFILYEIDPKYRLPYISYQKENPDWRNDPVWIDRNAEKILASSKEAPMREINPKKFEIDFEASEFSKNLILAEKFNPLWKAYTVDTSGKETEIKEHFLARGYANGWKIENPEGIDKIIVEYYPIRLMWWGIWISSATVLFLLGYLVKYYYTRSGRTTTTKL